MVKMTEIDNDLTFRRLEETDIEQYIGILKDFFGQNYYGSDIKFIEWQYKNSVFQKENEGYSILAAFKGNQIMAIDAYLPWKFYCDGKEHSALWDIEWLNNSKIKGLGRRLVKKVNDSVEIYCGYGYNSYSLKAYQDMNFSLNDEIERKIAFLDEEKCLTLFSNGQNEVFIKSNIVKDHQKSFVLHTSIETISERYWIDLLNNTKVTSYKGLDYLQWRFFDHPYLKYHVISSDPAAESGIAVLRIETVKHSTHKIARIVDLMPLKGHEQTLLDAIITFCHQNDVIFADFYCISYTVAERICPEPFISIRNHRQYDIPMLFQPLELRERRSINFVLNNNTDTPFCFDDIYATKADSDQDVYLNADYKTVLL